jgi:hypothetical protein
MQPRRRRPPRAGALTDLPPLKIIKKIVLLQTAYYVCATILIVFTALVAGAAFSPDLILSWRSLRGDTTVGWMLSFVWLLNSSIGYVRHSSPIPDAAFTDIPFYLDSVIFILILVSRSKLVPDFALTLHFIHLLVTSFYTHSLPGNLLWWGLQAASATLMTLLGIWVCQWRELRPITFGIPSNNTAAAAQQAEAESRIVRFVQRIIGWSRDEDGGGSYEMVAVKDHTSEPV